MAKGLKVFQYIDGINDIPFPNNSNDEQIELGAIYIFNGSLGIINYWVQNDFTSKPEDIAEIISELSYNGIKKYIYKNM